AGSPLFLIRRARSRLPVRQPEPRADRGAPAARPPSDGSHKLHRRRPLGRDLSPARDTAAAGRAAAPRPRRATETPAAPCQTGPRAPSGRGGVLDVRDGHALIANILPALRRHDLARGPRAP